MQNNAVYIMRALREALNLQKQLKRFCSDLADYRQITLLWHFLWKASLI